MIPIIEIKIIDIKKIVNVDIIKARRIKNRPKRILPT